MAHKAFPIRGLKCRKPRTRKWFKIAAHRASRRLWRAKGEDAPMRVTSPGWAD